MIGNPMIIWILQISNLDASIEVILLLLSRELQEEQEQPRLLYPKLNYLGEELREILLPSLS